jgi:hypothetical protein
MAEGQRQFRFADSRWTKKEERTLGAARMGESQFPAPEYRLHPTEDMILPDDIPA